jgi:hypothetical protein
MSCKKILILIFLVLLFPIVLYGDIVINAFATNPDARIFPVGNIDFTQTGTIPSFYKFTLQNTGPSPVRIKLFLTIELDGQPILEAESNEFDLDVGTVYTISHQQLNLGTLPPINGQQVNFVKSEYNLGQVSDLEDVAIRTGRLKAGRYEVKITARDVNTFQDFFDFFELIITNPTSVYIFYPGGPINDKEVKTINTLFPFLQWFSDAEIFNIFVWDKKPEANDVPILEVRNYRERFLQYPASTSPLPLSGGGEFVGPVRLLEYNKDYFWLVEAVIPVVSGSPIKIKTDYFKFRVLEPGQSPTAGSNRWSLLEQLLGPDHPLLKQLKAEGYAPDDRIFEDDKPVDDTKVIEWANKVQMNKAEIVNATLKNK